jgi:hypothetical protein
MGDIMKILIDGKEYVAKTESEYKIVRTRSAGVFAGEIESKDGTSVVMRNARQIWYRDEAGTLSQLAMEGTSNPENCKFPCPVDRVELFEVITILDCTDTAKKSIQGMEICKA